MILFAIARFDNTRRVRVPRRPSSEKMRDLDRLAGFGLTVRLLRDLASLNLKKRENCD